MDAEQPPVTPDDDAARPAVVGVVSPGAMGAALAAAWRAGGTRTVATLHGRSARTAALADGVELLPDLDAVVAAAGLVVSIVPPDRAVGVARQVAAAARRTGARPQYLDANAISPATLDRVAQALRPVGLVLLDGAISGGPPHPGDMTTLYLSGPSVGQWRLDGPGLRTVELSRQPGAASAVKMCTASVYKGFSALLLQALATADVNGVLEPVTADLREAFPDSIDRAGRAIALSATKAHRFVGEMREIAATQGAAGLRPELFDAMATVWAAVADSPLARSAPEDVDRPDLAATLAALRAR